MPRLPELTNRDELPADHFDAFDYIAGSRGSVGLPFSVLLNSPEACQRVAQVGTYARFESPLPRRDIELTTLAAAREIDCAFEWAAHVPMARTAGVPESTIQVVGTRGDLSQLTPHEAMIVGAVRQLLGDHRMDDVTFGAALQSFGRAGVVDFITTMSYYAMLASLINAFEIQPWEGADALPQR